MGWVGVAFVADTSEATVQKRILPRAAPFLIITAWR
jgi:hypothetical protein